MPRQQAPTQARKPAPKQAAPAPKPAPVQNRKPAPQAPAKAKAAPVKQGPDSLELLTLYLSKTFDTYLDSMAAVLNETIDAVEALRDSPKEFLDNWYATYSAAPVETEEGESEEEPEEEEEEESEEEESEDFYEEESEEEEEEEESEEDTYEDGESYWEDEPEPEPARPPARQTQGQSARSGNRR